MIIYCDSEAEREQRIEEADRRDKWFHKKSRQDAQSKTTRRFLTKRAKSCCELCQFKALSVLVIHHIIPVQLGGSAKSRNLILICPNCHALVHHYSHFRKPKCWPDWTRGLMSYGYSESQSLRLLLVASREAIINDDGRIEYCESPEPSCYMLINEIKRVGVMEL